LSSRRRATTESAKVREALRFQVGSELSAAQRGSKLASPKKRTQIDVEADALREREG